MNHIERKLIKEASNRIKHLIDARDMDTIKLLWKMCAYIGGDDFEVEFAESDKSEKEMCDKLNKRISDLLEPYYLAHTNRLDSEYFKGVRRGINIGVDLANEGKEPKKDYAKAVERFYKAMEEDDQKDD